MDCTCGGYWDWVNKGSLGPKPSFIPIGLTDESQVDGWKWEYICNNNCGEELLESSLSKTITVLFPGQGNSSSSSSPVCICCGSPLGSPHAWSCLFRGYSSGDMYGDHTGGC